MAECPLRGHPRCDEGRFILWGLFIEDACVCESRRCLRLRIKSSNFNTISFSPIRTEEWMIQ